MKTLAVALPSPALHPTKRVPLQGMLTKQESFLARMRSVFLEAKKIKEGDLQGVSAEEFLQHV